MISASGSALINRADRVKPVASVIAWMCLIGLAGESLIAEDTIEKALAAVRGIKADLFSNRSSVLGRLPGPAELADVLPTLRFIPKSDRAATFQFDDALKKRIARDYRHNTFKGPGRLPGPMIPLGVTGAHIYDIAARGELFVIGVEDGSPAAKCLRKDDIIIGANGRLFDDPEDPRPSLGAALAESQSPELEGKLTLQIVRDGQPMNVVCELG
ncbi:MAG: DUF6288 domain-containing protein, partial [Planctomycetota bacterium]|nr:DUF6288 domain-containing protein [Planctomycetota bacterium]